MRIPDFLLARSLVFPDCVIITLPSGALMRLLKKNSGIESALIFEAVQVLNEEKPACALNCRIETLSTLSQKVHRLGRRRWTLLIITAWCETPVTSEAMKWTY